VAFPRERAITLLGPETGWSPVVRTMLAALWVDRGNGLAALPVLQACRFVALADTPREADRRAAQVLVRTHSDETLAAFLGAQALGEDWLEDHHAAHAARVAPPVRAATPRDRRLEAALARMERHDGPHRSVVFCACGAAFDWEGIDDGLDRFVHAHLPHYPDLATPPAADPATDEVADEATGRASEARALAEADRGSDP
jgi:hypothetical protein